MWCNNAYYCAELQQCVPEPKITIEVLYLTEDTMNKLFI